MAKATTSKTEMISIRVPLELVTEWRATATKAGIAVGALVLDLAKRGMRLSAASVPGVDRASRLSEHPAGPLLASAVPERARGEVVPNFKPGQKVAQEKVGAGKGKRP